MKLGKLPPLCAAALLASLAALPPANAAAPDPIDDAAAQAWSDLTGRAVSDFLALAAQKAAFNARIAAARQDFFDLYPDGPALEAANNKFDDLLLAKELMYLQQGAAFGLEKPESRKAFRQLGIVGASFVGGQIDGGIRPLARPAFERLIDAIRADIRADNVAAGIPVGEAVDPLIVTPASFVAALRKNPDKLTGYQLARDYDEFLAAGERMPAYDDPRAYTLLMMQVYGPLTPREAAENYQALRNSAGEKVLKRAATKVSAVPQTRDGLLADIASLGLTLAPEMAEHEFAVPTGTDAEGNTIVANAEPLTALHALWRRSSPKVNAVFSIAEAREMPYVDSWRFCQDLASALDQKTFQHDDPATFTVLALLDEPETTIEQALEDYQAIRKAVGGKNVLKAARQVADVPLDGAGQLTDIARLKLVRYRDLPESETELPAGKNADGKTVVWAATPKLVLKALWSRDNPQAYAFQLIADTKRLTYADAWRLYKAIEAAVGRKKLKTAAAEVYAAPKRAGDIAFRGLLVTPVPPGTATWMYRPFEKLQADLLAGDDTRSQIRYFIALEATGADAIDRTYEQLADITGEEALLAAASDLRAAGWKTTRGGVIDTLRDTLEGKR